MDNVSICSQSHKFLLQPMKGIRISTTEASSEAQTLKQLSTTEHLQTSAIHPTNKRTWVQVGRLSWKTTWVSRERKTSDTSTKIFQFKGCLAHFSPTPTLGRLLRPPLSRRTKTTSWCSRTSRLSFRTRRVASTAAPSWAAIRRSLPRRKSSGQTCQANYPKTKNYSQRIKLGSLIQLCLNITQPKDNNSSRSYSTRWQSNRWALISKRKLYSSTRVTESASKEQTYCLRSKPREAWSSSKKPKDNFESRVISALTWGIYKIKGQQSWAIKTPRTKGRQLTTAKLKWRLCRTRKWKRSFRCSRFKRCRGRPPLYSSKPGRAQGIQTGVIRATRATSPNKVSRVTKIEVLRSRLLSSGSSTTILKSKEPWTLQ